MSRRTLDYSGDKNPNWRGGYSKVAHKENFRRKFPEKALAHDIFRKALARHQITRPDKCSNCGCTCTPHGHHDDYSKPLEVRWLCRPCHLNLHYKLRLAQRKQLISRPEQERGVA